MGGADTQARLRLEREAADGDGGSAGVRWIGSRMYGNDRCNLGASVVGLLTMHQRIMQHRFIIYKTHLYALQHLSTLQHAGDPSRPSVNRLYER